MWQGCDGKCVDIEWQTPQHDRHRTFGGKWRRYEGCPGTTHASTNSIGGYAHENTREEVKPSKLAGVVKVTKNEKGGETT